jgi:hypothetical protein
MIITATLMVVAAMANPIIKRENVFWLLKAMRFAMNEDTFNILNLVSCKTNIFKISQ